MLANHQAMEDTEAFIRTDMAFHFEFARMADNAVLRTIYDAMSSWLTDRRRAAPVVGVNFELVHQAHKRIFEAVAARDADAAEQAMQDHLEMGWKLQSAEME